MFLFNSKKALSTCEIESNLKKYHDMVNEPINYQVGDYVIVKPEVKELELLKHLYYPSSLRSNYTYATNFYILEIDGNIVTAAFIYNGLSVKIERIKGYYYHKNIREEVEEDLERFVNDKSVSKSVEPGTLVRPRIHYHIANNYSSSSSLANATAYHEPFIVMKNEDGYITIAAYIKNEDGIDEFKVKWYTLAMYIK